MPESEREPAGSAPPLHDHAPDRDLLRAELLAALRARGRSIPSKLLYDARGSDLFERICELDEYYITRTELQIMESHAKEMARLLGRRCMLIEYGSGSGRKTRLLIEHLDEPCAYVPIDISRTALDESASRLCASYPDLTVLPVCADYTGSYEIPTPIPEPDRRVVYFPGSTIGNFTPERAVEFLEHVTEAVGEDGGLLIGVDLEKDPEQLRRAYDDAEGVTAEFELNVLERLNREFGADFRPERFRYVALYNREESRIEMYLESLEEQRVRVAGQEIALARGERILTEYAYKFSPESFGALACDAGLAVERVWTDPEQLFSVQYLTVA